MFVSHELGCTLGEGCLGLHCVEVIAEVLPLTKIISEKTPEIL